MINYHTKILTCIIKEHFWSKDKCLSMNRRERIEKQQSTKKSLDIEFVPRPPLFLASVTIHNNTQEWKITSVYYCECKRKVKMGEAWE